MKKFLKYSWENITLKRDHDRIESFLYLILYGYMSGFSLFMVVMMILDGNKHVMYVIWQPILMFVIIFSVFVISVSNYQVRFKSKVN